MTDLPELAALSAPARARLAALPAASVPPGTVLFRPDETAQIFGLVLAGRIEVFLTGPSGREIMLYGVEPGQSCIQTTLGLMADEPYSAEAIATTEVRLIAVPRALFQELIDGEPAFRGFVLRAFARRMADMTRLLERVAFARVEARLAEALLALARAGEVQATHADLAARIGSAREVVSRRLEAFARAGWVATDRGHVRLLDPSALRRLAASMA
jgi:CRP/FNR family transcriptional regulator